MIVNSNHQIYYARKFQTGCDTTIKGGFAAENT